MKKVSVTLIMVLAFFLNACSSSSGLEISGSTSIAPLMEDLVKAYEKETNINIHINADGSSAGIKAVNEGVSNIGMSSRELKGDEKDLGLNNLVIAYDAIGIVVNVDNDIENLTIDQLHDIFSGKIRNWKAVGGMNLPIVVISREDGSGTRGAFEEMIDLLNEDESSKVDASIPVIVNSTGATLENVRQKIGAIGYVSAGSIEGDVKILKVNGVLPTSESIRNQQYKISLNFNLLTKKEDEATQKFLEFILSEKGQSIINEKGFTGSK